MNFKKITIVPIRDDSTRLKEKATGFTIHKKMTPVECLGKRLLFSKHADHVLFLVPSTEKNKTLIKKIECLMKKDTIFNYYSGDEDDISGRALTGIKSVPYDYHGGYETNNIMIINITGDCLVVDPFQIDFLVEKFIAEKKKNPNTLLYVSNVVTRSYPDGFDIQIYDHELLKLSRYISLDKKETTNLGWDIINYSGYLAEMGIDFKILNYPAPEKFWCPNYFLVLDYKEDIPVLQVIYNHFNRFDFTQEEVISFIKDNPQLLTNSLQKRKIPGEM